MPKIPRPIDLKPYDPNWPQMFELEASDIRAALKGKGLEIHHIGSTSIPGMQAKEDLDILLVVSSLKDSLELEKHGFSFKGELNVPLRYFFSKNTQRSKINLHVCEKGHPFINLNLTFRDHLRTHPKAAEEYANVKLQALKNPNAHHKIRWFLSHYSSFKSSFIKSILKAAGFEDLMANFCMHNEEWEEYHRIKREQIIEPAHVEYDKNHPSFFDKSHFHFVLYLGTKVIGTAHIQMIGNKTAILRPFCLDSPYQKKGYGAYFLNVLESWLKLHDVDTLYLHANVTAIGFYEKRGYKKMSFTDPDGPGLPTKSEDMGKIL